MGEEKDIGVFYIFNPILLVTIEQSIIKAVYSHHVISSSTLVPDGIEHSTSCHLCLMFYIRFEIRVKQLRDDPHIITPVEIIEDRLFLLCLNE